MPALYIGGIGGIGKSTLAAKLLDRPGADLDATLVIRCNELLMPVESLAKLAHFWQAQGLDKHAEAAALLMDSRHDPADALERFRESLEIKRRIEDESGVADSLGELGKLLRNAGQMREAIAAFTEALGIFQRQGSSKMGISLSMLGEIHERQGEYAAALEKYQQARLIYQQAMPTNLPIIERKIARVREKMGG